MSPEIFVVAMFLGVLIGVFLGFPIGFTLAGLGIIFGYIGWGDRILTLIGNSTFAVLSNYTFVAIPLFVFMGCMLDSSGIASRAFDVLAQWMRGIRGGIALACIIICTLFAACSGIVGASVTTMGLLALPPMINRGYNKGLACGVVASGGTLGILIPPSIMLVMFGPLAGLSVVDLFAAAIMPGLLLSALYAVYIVVLPMFKKDWIPPRISKEDYEKKYSLIHGLLTFAPFILLILAVLGAIFFGVCSPTEAAGLGAFGSLVLAVAFRSLNLKNLKATLLTTLKTSSMILFVAVGANFFTSMFFSTGGSKVVAKFLLELEIGRYGILAALLIVVFLLGMLIDWVGILLIVVPIFMPILVNELGFNGLWVGMLIIVIMQSSFLTPPFAYSLFYIKGVAPAGVTIGDIYRGVIPFIVLQIFGLILCIVFPQIITWLPEVMSGLR